MGRARWLSWDAWETDKLRKEQARHNRVVETQAHADAYRQGWTEGWSAGWAAGYAAARKEDQP
jgi:flagellar biosynthesis/type III secretory pathway protein FliH